MELDRQNKQLQTCNQTSYVEDLIWSLWYFWHSGEYRFLQPVSKQTKFKISCSKTSLHHNKTYTYPNWSLPPKFQSHPCDSGIRHMFDDITNVEGNNEVSQVTAILSTLHWQLHFIQVLFRFCQIMQVHIHIPFCIRKLSERFGTSSHSKMSVNYKPQWLSSVLYTYSTHYKNRKKVSYPIF